jgi:hypothetical protein
MAYVRETVEEHHHQNQPSLPVKLQTAYDILQPYRLTFNIAQIDRCLNLTDRGGGSSNSLCITSSLKDGSWQQQRHVNDTLLTRLCVRALLSRRQGGFESPSVIFIDAGNHSDIYQCVNFARQYGLDIQKVIDSIIVSRPFNLHQLAGLLINELDPAIISHRFGGAKLIVISDLLRTLVQDTRIDPDEALWLVKEISRALRRLSSHVLLVVSMHDCPTRYSRFLLSLFYNRIYIITTTTTKEPGSFEVKVKSNFLHNRHNEVSSSSGKSESSFSSFILTERDLKVVPAR